MRRLIWLWLFLGFAWAQDNVQEENSEPEVPTYLSSPRATMETFLVAMAQAKDGGSFDQGLETLELGWVDSLTRQSTGRKLAEDLIYCIDRIAYVEIEKIPVAPKTDRWIFKTVAMEKGKAAISISKMQDGAWRFDQATLEGLETLRAHLRTKQVVEGVKELRTWRSIMEEKYPWLTGKAFLLENWQWLLLILLIVVATIVEKIVVSLVGGYAFSWLENREVGFSASGRKRLQLPFRIVSYASVFYFGLILLQIPPGILAFCLRALLVLLAIGFVWAALNITDVISNYFSEVAKKTDNKFDDLLVPLISKTAKVLIVIIGILVVAQSVGEDLTALLTGLGIGGLAFALAAKDTIANFFGSLTVLVDQPFQIGDWVVIGSVEGVVEEVGFRSTRIRTFHNSQITMPNSLLTNQAIDNYGRRQYRRLSTKLGVEYNTPPEKIEAFCEAIRQIILTHPYTRKDAFQVYFNGFGDSALEILVYMFWEVPTWDQELMEKHRFLMDVLRLGHELGVSFAFPTQTLHVIKEDAPSHQPLGKPPLSSGREVGRSLASNTISPRDPRSGSKTGDFPNDDIGMGPKD